MSLWQLLRTVVAFAAAVCIVASNVSAASGPKAPASPKGPMTTTSSLAGNPLDPEPQISESALHQMNLLAERKLSRTPQQRKIQERLLLARDRLFGNLGPELASLRTTVETLPGNPKMPLVDLGFDRGNFRSLYKTLDSMPFVEVMVALPSGIQVAVPFDRLEDLAAIDQVRWVREAATGTTSSGTRLSPVHTSAPVATTAVQPSRSARANVVRNRLAPLFNAHAIAAQKGGHATPEIVNTSEGDIAHRAMEARSFFGVDGSGVSIGVLSNGVDSLAASQTSGDLGPVTVLAGQAGSGDEGTAMLEIVHDLAPGANLFFATAGSSQAQFAQNILDLRAAGCDIIVDDVIFFAESPFRDGGNTPNTLIANAVQTVTADGAMYFSSAGNEGNLNDGTSGVWEGMFVASSGSIPVLAGAGQLHTFGGAASNTSDQVTASANTTILNWDNPIGTAADDYDFYVMNSGLSTIFDASTDTQDGAGGDDFPVEITGVTFTGERIVVALFAGNPQFLRFQAFRGRLSASTSGATYGHSTVADAFGVAAVDVATTELSVNGTGPFVGGPANPVEQFSADGTRRLFTQSDGSPFPGGFVDRQKPDIAAADGVATSAPGFNPFFGTSAAAPHAAAIAGLVKSSNLALTPAQIRGFLTSSALDIEAAGVDRDSGAGIVMAFQALQASGAMASPFLALQSSTAFEVSGNGSGFFDPCERVGLSVTLVNNGGASATNVASTLTSNSPGVTVEAGTSTFADMPASGSASNDMPLTVALDQTVVCGSVVDLTLTVTYDPGGNTIMIPLGFIVGRPGTPLTFSFAGAPVSIPDAVDLTGTNPGAPALVPLNVAGVGGIFDVDFRIDGVTCSSAVGSTTVGIKHSFVNDLEVKVISPSGTQVLAIDNADGSGNNYCQTVLDDESSGPSIQSITTPMAPFTGSFRPNQALSAFDGENADGTWMLSVQDFFQFDTGDVRAFSLIITPAVCDPVTPSFVNCPTTINASADPGQCSAVVNYTPPTNVSACVTVDCMPAPGSTFPVGTTTVTCTATPTMGLAPTGSSSQCTFTVVVTDDEAPAITCPADVTADATTGSGCALSSVVNYPAPVVSDNCPGVGAPVCSPPSGSTFTDGVTTVTCSVIDANGNSANCAFTVTVAVDFDVCVIGQNGDRFEFVADPTNPLYRTWRYTVLMTGMTICGSANSPISYAPNVKLKASDNNYSAENPTYYMDANILLSKPSGTVVIRNRVTGAQNTLRVVAVCPTAPV